MKTTYDPAAKFEIKVSEVEFRRTPAGRQLMARIYQPQGAGTVPDAARSARRRLERARTASPRSRWTARSRRAACSWSRST